MNRKIEEILKDLTIAKYSRQEPFISGLSVASKKLSNLLDQEREKFFDWAVEKLAYSDSETTTHITTSEFLSLYKAEMNNVDK